LAHDSIYKEEEGLVAKAKKKKRSKDYNEPANCHVCGKDFMARYNFKGRAKVCTSPDHICKPGKKKLRNGGIKVIQCVDNCCRAKYRISAAQQAMDNPIDDRKFFTDSEFADAMKESRHIKDPHGVAIRFIGATGCRVGEALLVRVGDLRLDANQAGVKVPTLKRGGRPVRTVHLHDPNFVKELGKWGEGKNANALLFTAARRTLQRNFTRIVDKLSMDKESGIHILRHTRASQLIAAGFDLNYVRMQLGWSSLSMATIYVHVDEAKLEKIGKKLPSIR
jgi:integrase